MTLEQARIKANEFNVIVGQLKDPSKPSTELTYGMLFQRYLDDYAKLQTSTWESAIYNHEKYFQRWHNKPINQIKRLTVQAWVNDLAKEHGVHTANRNYNTMRAVFSWGLHKDIFAGENPCLGVDNFNTFLRKNFWNFCIGLDTATSGKTQRDGLSLSRMQKLQLGLFECVEIDIRIECCTIVVGNLYRKDLQLRFLFC